MKAKVEVTYEAVIDIGDFTPFAVKTLLAKDDSDFSIFDFVETTVSSVAVEAIS